MLFDELLLKYFGQLIETRQYLCYISFGQFAASRFSSLSGALMCDSK
jgi:hypothetical protein